MSEVFGCGLSLENTYLTKFRVMRKVQPLGPKWVLSVDDCRLLCQRNNAATVTRISKGRWLDTDSERESGDSYEYSRDEVFCMLRIASALMIQSANSFPYMVLMNNWNNAPVRPL